MIYILTLQESITLLENKSFSPIFDPDELPKCKLYASYCPPTHELFCYLDFSSQLPEFSQESRLILNAILLLLFITCFLISSDFS